MFDGSINDVATSAEDIPWSISSPIGIQQILAYLPHRFPFLLIDKVVDYKKSKYIHAIKLLSVNEPYFSNYENKYLAMPQMMVLESIAQTAAVLALVTTDAQALEHSLFYLLGVKDAHFYGAAVPGDRLQINVELIYNRKGVWRFKGTMTNGIKLIAGAEIIGAQDKGLAKNKQEIS
jgi:3-hydroxyacyl-[acyl-carrier-protein] dehydratase